jgi:hypothetical protein
VQQWLAEHPILGALAGLAVLGLLIGAVVCYYQMKGDGNIDS